MDPSVSKNPVLGNKHKLIIPPQNMGKKQAVIDPRLKYNVIDDAYGTSAFGEAREILQKAVGRSGQSCTNAFDYSHPVTFFLNVPTGHLGIPNHPNTIMIEYQVFYTDVTEGTADFYDHNKWKPLKAIDNRVRHRLVKFNEFTAISDCLEEIRVDVDGRNIVNNYAWDIRSKANYVTRTLANSKVIKQRLGIMPFELNPADYNYHFHDEAVKEANANNIAVTAEKKFTTDWITNEEDVTIRQDYLDSLLITNSERDTRKMYGNLECPPLLGNPYSPTMVSLENAKRYWLSHHDTEINLSELKERLNGSISNVFPPEMKLELGSELRGRTVLILIELAFQETNKTNISNLSNILNISHQTVSNEIKRLLSIEYIQPHMSIESLTDSRYKYYALTTKGIVFLHILKESLTQALIHIDNGSVAKTI